jgi:hypothetical protein
LIGGLAGAVAVVLVVALELVPALQPDPPAFHVSIPLNAGQDGQRTITFPIGSHVSRAWSTSNGVDLEVSISTSIAGVGVTVYENGAPSDSGSFSFIEAGTVYHFAAEYGGGPVQTKTVQFVGSY